MLQRLLRQRPLLSIAPFRPAGLTAIALRAASTASVAVTNDDDAALAPNKELAACKSTLRLLALERRRLRAQRMEKERKERARVARRRLVMRLIQSPWHVIGAPLPTSGFPMYKQLQWHKYSQQHKGLTAVERTLQLQRLFSELGPSERRTYAQLAAKVKRAKKKVLSKVPQCGNMGGLKRLLIISLERELGRETANTLIYGTATAPNGNPGKARLGGKGSASKQAERQVAVAWKEMHDAEQHLLSDNSGDDAMPAGSADVSGDAGNMVGKREGGKVGKRKGGAGKLPKTQRLTDAKMRLLDMLEDAATSTATKGLMH